MGIMGCAYFSHIIIGIMRFEQYFKRQHGLTAYSNPTLDLDIGIGTDMQ